jgi:hypothetical protein
VPIVNLSSITQSFFKIKLDHNSALPAQDLQSHRNSSATRCQCYKTLFSFSLMMRPNKIELLSLASLSSLVYYLRVRPGPNVINRFPTVINQCSESARVFVPGKLFQSSQLFVSKSGAYPS